ncbi:HD-GYP domain-containing protein [Paenibacillus silviterrae]|uniref:HD-GYP domain-containing protein n=1 Tax=Paenibacillus silviterrae TaxID=3242194 RepID=UPI002542EB40|nr:HD domain-containing phosphohydrolase [Paenibacillus chinjuensis]
MRLLPISFIQPGMRLGKPIVTEEGKTLLGYHVELTQGVLTRLRQMGFHQLYIEDPRTDDIRIEDPLREETRTLVRGNLLRIFQTMMSSGGELSNTEKLMFAKAATQSVQGILDDVQASSRPNDDTIVLMDLNRRSHSPMEHFTQNAVNVCVYATRLGLTERFTKDDLYAIALGGMFHDIGNSLISPKLLQKDSSLSPQEYSEIQKHTEYGYKILKELPGMPLLAAHCALQHHEKFSGGGYPSGLSGSSIHSFAQWVGLLDAYDAMINPRPYRSAIPPDYALEMLFAGAGTLYDKCKVEGFRNKVAIYPVGLSVRLSTGESGLVSRINHSYKQRPVVRVLTSPSGEDLKHPYEIDLSRHLHIMIFRVGEDALVH